MPDYAGPIHYDRIKDLVNEIALWRNIAEIAAKDDQGWQLDTMMRATEVNLLTIMRHRLECVLLMQQYLATDFSPDTPAEALQHEKRTQQCRDNMRPEFVHVEREFREWKARNTRLMMQYIPGELMHSPWLAGNETKVSAGDDNP